MALLPVTILAFNHIIFSSAEDSCPKEINTIFSKRNDLNDCKDQKDPPKNLNITNFKPDPPEISKLYDGNILGKNQKFPAISIFLSKFQYDGPLQPSGLRVRTFCSYWNS